MKNKDEQTFSYSEEDVEVLAVALRAAAEKVRDGYVPWVTDKGENK